MQFEKTLIVSNTSLMGYVTASYDRLVEVFGGPTYDEPSGDGKVDIEWNLEFEDGTIATIYNWKDYDGGLRCKTEQDYVWHVGGKSKMAELLVIETLLTAK